MRPSVSPDAGGARMTGGRLAAAFWMMLASIGAMITFLDDAGFAQPDWPPAIIAAACSRTEPPTS